MAARVAPAAVGAGASSVAQAFIEPWRAEGLAAPPAAHVAPAAGPVFVPGQPSSPVSAAQAAHAAVLRHRRAAVAALAQGDAALRPLAERCAALLRQGRPVLARTSAPPAARRRKAARGMHCRWTWRAPAAVRSRRCRAGAAGAAHRRCRRRHLELRAARARRLGARLAAPLVPNLALLRLRPTTRGTTASNWCSRAPDRGRMSSSGC
ncbi:MAG: hypothetical protein U1F49_17850 [Rubrivivax sp.]